MNSAPRHPNPPVEEPRCGEIARALFARSTGLVTEALRSRRVLCAGAGSVGSYVAEQLIRSGVGHLHVIDPDTVEPANLSRTVYRAADIGSPKTEALKSLLTSINPEAEIVTCARPVQQTPADEIPDLFAAADLVLAMTDDPGAQSFLNRFARHYQIPALFTGLYRVARGGEVALSVPGLSPCYLCATGGRREAEQISSQRVSRDADYGTGRLQGEIALGCDIQHVASATIKLVLSLLVRGEEEAALSTFATDALGQGFGTLTLSTTPHFWFYPTIFRETPGQFAYQGVWLSFESNPDCPVCGAPENREDPFEAPAAAPGRAGLASLAAATATADDETEAAASP